MSKKKLGYIGIIIIIIICIISMGKGVFANEYDWNKFEVVFLDLFEKEDIVSAKEFLKILPEDHLSSIEMKKGREKIDLVFSPEYFFQLEDLTKSGDIIYINILYRLKNLTDGAYTEYLDILLGSLIVDYPKNFLLSLNENIDNNLNSLDSILGNLGPKYVDKFELQLEELERRYNALEKTQNTSKVIKELCLSKLKNQICETQEDIRVFKSLQEKTVN